MAQVYVCQTDLLWGTHKRGLPEAYREAIQSRQAIASDLAVSQIEAAKVSQSGQQRQSSITDAWVVSQGQ